MKISILILTSLLLLAGCFPLIKESDVPQAIHYKITELFKNGNENIVVIPVWEKYPLLMYEESIKDSSTLSFCDPVFVKVDDLVNVHNLIPGKTSIGMIIGPGGAIGRGVFFYGFFIISETGNIFFMDKSNNIKDLSNHFSISAENKKELLEAFGQPSKEIITDKTTIWTFLDRKKIYLNFSDAERKMIISFLANINPTH